MPKLLLVIDRKGWRFFLREGRQPFPLAAFAPEADILPDDLRDRQALFELRDEQLEILIRILAILAILVHSSSLPRTARQGLWTSEEICGLSGRLLLREGFAHESACFGEVHASGVSGFEFGHHAPHIFEALSA